MIPLIVVKGLHFFTINPASMQQLKYTGKGMKGKISAELRKS